MEGVAALKNWKLSDKHDDAEDTPDLPEPDDVDRLDDDGRPMRLPGGVDGGDGEDGDKLS